MARYPGLFVLTVGCLLFLSTPVSAFGAGYVAPGSHLKDSRFRHGDIALAVPLLATANRRLVKQIYFGNWLRDFSQLLDKGSVALVPRPILSALVAVFAFLQFGYSTREFEVTNERLGLYRPEEHIDNPKGYDETTLEPAESSNLQEAPEPAVGKADDDGYRISEGLRPDVHPTELAIDANTGMKNYVANTPAVGNVNPTSAEYVERQLIAAIACGRQGNEEAYIHLGAALHTLEDFAAHTNYVELALQLIGSEIQDQANLRDFVPAMKNVFTFVGGAAKVETARGRASPMVTGTFGMLDLYQTILSEVDDTLSAVSVRGLELRTPSDDGSSIQRVAKDLTGLLNGFTPHFEKNILQIQKTASESRKEEATWGAFDDKPERLWELLEPVLKLRDDVVKWVYDNLTVKAVQEALATISGAIDKFVFTMLGIILRPLIPRLKRVLKEQEQRLLREDELTRATDREQSIFDKSATATNPTHSQLAKDHYDHPLNEIAGRVAVRISSYTISTIVQLWQPGNTIDPRPAVQSILEVLHHPFNSRTTNASSVQTHMLDEVRAYVRESLQADPQAFARWVDSLSLESMAARMNVHVHQPGGHTHVDTNGQTSKKGTEYWKGASIQPNPVAEKLSRSIERQVEQGRFSKFGVDDLPGLKDTLFASPSADSPNPLDAALAKLPGLSFVNTFHDIDVNELAAADGIGETLKDAVISLILMDDIRSMHEQDVAAAKFGTWAGDPNDPQARAQLEQLRPLLELKTEESEETNSKANGSKTGDVKEKLSAKFEKLKLKAGS